MDNFGGQLRYIQNICKEKQSTNGLEVGDLEGVLDQLRYHLKAQIEKFAHQFPNSNYVDVMFKEGKVSIDGFCTVELYDRSPYEEACNMIRKDDMCIAIDYIITSFSGVKLDKHTLRISWK